ncbi:unnamed protein product [Didymodactylos carnosus]|uniref:Uncharacterized protein n=2 Tax=Didymodactylos carnosus TaxID=1234261 RepID=A0A814N291_9BILA|nr:unnamed protein product [Didymodactylos carnosus]CAF3850159.1 unnamed protein product [Didymodactylos carnosus]
MYFQNEGCTPASFLANHDSPDFGVGLLPSILLHSLPEQITRTAFGNISADELKHLRSEVSDNLIYS